MRLDFLDTTDEKKRDMEYAVRRGEEDNGITFTLLEKDRCEAILPVRAEHMNL